MGQLSVKGRAEQIINRIPEHLNAAFDNEDGNHAADIRFQGNMRKDIDQSTDKHRERKNRIKPGIFTGRNK